MDTIKGGNAIRLGDQPRVLIDLADLATRTSVCVAADEFSTYMHKSILIIYQQLVQTEGARSDLIRCRSRHRRFTF